MNTNRPDLRVVLGGLTFQFDGADPRLAPLLQQVLGRLFQDAAEEDEVVHTRLWLRLNHRPTRWCPRPSLWRSAAAFDPGWHATRYDLAAAWFEQPAWGIASVQPTPLAVRSLLQLLLAAHLPAHGGLAIHAASLVHQGLAYLFPARSGIGKSTLVRSSGGAPALADEISLVGPGPDGSYRVYPSPFWSGTGPPDLEPQPHPLHRICFLEQAPTLRRSSVPSSLAVDRLLQHCLVHGGDARHAGQLLEVTARVCQRVAAETLALPQGPSVWPGLAEPA